MAEARTTKRGIRRESKGQVVSKSGDKSVVVRVTNRRRHPLYGKVITLSRKFHVHDEGNLSSPGDVVRIVECHPVSRQKRWRLAAVLQARSAG